MHPNNVTNPVNREKLKQVLKKYNMSFDAYLEEKIEEDYSLIQEKEMKGQYKRFMQGRPPGLFGLMSFTFRFLSAHNAQEMVVLTGTIQDH